MSSSWFSRLFQGHEERRGPRGGDLSALIGYPGLRLRHHSAGDDLISNPRLIWEDAAFSGQGLMEQILSTPDAAFTDVLLVLSQPDFLRATATGGVPWLVRLQAELTEAYDSLRHGHPHLPPRRLHVRMAMDGSGDVGQQDFGLNAGEFITGLIPQLYTGRSNRSKAELVIHLNLPAVDAEYRRVGQLYDDQLCFTLGSHWLDSYGHPELEQPGLFRVFRDTDGQPVYELRSDLEGAYRLDMNKQQGVMVLTLSRADEPEPLAHLVLDLVGADAATQDHRAEALARMRLSQPLEAMRAQLDAQEAAQARVSEARRANAPIDNVIVFADRAVVTRVRSVVLREGLNKVRFEGLLPWLSAGRLEATVRSGRAQVLDVVALSSAEDRSQSRAGALTDARAVLDGLDELAQRVADLLRQRATVGRTLLQLTPDVSRVGSVEGLRGRLADLGHAEQRIDTLILEALRQAAALDDRLAPLLERLSAPASAGQVAQVHLKAASAGPVEIALRYPVPQARWTPRYRARFHSATSRLELECTGDVHQSTGEDWRGVKLFLSPSLADAALDPPAPGRWTLNEGPELAAMLAAQPEASLTVMSGREGPAGEADLLELPEAVSVADGEEVQLLVAQRRLSVTLERSAAPRVQPKVYRSARPGPWQGSPFPEGPVTCYVDGQFVGAGRLPLLKGERPAPIGLGVDPELRVERLLVKREVEPTEGGARHRFHYRVYVHSRSKAPSEVEVIEQIPSGDAHVTLERSQTHEGQRPVYDAEAGLLRCRLSVPSQGVAMLDTAFTVQVSD